MQDDCPTTGLTQNSLCVPSWFLRVTAVMLTVVTTVGVPWALYGTYALLSLQNSAAQIAIDSARITELEKSRYILESNIIFLQQSQLKVERLDVELSQLQRDFDRRLGKEVPCETTANGPTANGSTANGSTVSK